MQKIPRLSRSKSAPIRAVKDYMRHSGYVPTYQEVSGFTDHVHGWDLASVTPEAFAAYLGRG